MSRIPHCIANPSSTTHALIWEIEFPTHSQQTEYYLYFLLFVSPVRWPISAVLSSAPCPFRPCTAVDCLTVRLSRIITFRHFHESPLTNYWHPWPLAFDWSPTVPALEEPVTPSHVYHTALHHYTLARGHVVGSLVFFSGESWFKSLSFCPHRLMDIPRSFQSYIPGIKLSHYVPPEWYLISCPLYTNHHIPLHC
jgi:hypothetical protein